MTALRKLKIITENKERLGFWANIVAIGYNSVAAVVTGLLGYTILMIVGIVSAIVSGIFAWWLWRRGQKRKVMQLIERE
jgi:Flp pilus assembly protein TadB